MIILNIFAIVERRSNKNTHVVPIAIKNNLEFLTRIFLTASALVPRLKQPAALRRARLNCPEHSRLRTTTRDLEEAKIDAIAARDAESPRKKREYREGGKKRREERLVKKARPEKTLEMHNLPRWCQGLPE